MPTRRSFLVGGTGVAALAALRGSVLQAAVATMQKSDAAAVTRLSDGWEYLQGTMGGASGYALLHGEWVVSDACGGGESLCGGTDVAAL